MWQTSGGQVYKSFTKETGKSGPGTEGAFLRADNRGTQRSQQRARFSLRGDPVSADDDRRKNRTGLARTRDMGKQGGFEFIYAEGYIERIDG